MQTQWVRFNARIPAEVHEWLRTRAFHSRRSINGEIVEQLDFARKEQARRAEETTAGSASQT